MSPEARGAARAFVRSLNILLKFARLYEFGHVRTAAQFDTTWDELRQALEDSGYHGHPFVPQRVEQEEAAEARRLTRCLAVAGFAEKDLTVEVREGVLTVQGKHSDDREKTGFLYQGIAGRAFERRFQLADHVEVKGAQLENGLLHVDLVREVPEAAKPRTIAINGGKAKTVKQIDQVAA